MNMLPKERRVVARGATAIWLILSSLSGGKKKVLVPSNICYAAVYPILYSGNIPVFCDVDRCTGNVTRRIVEDVLERKGPFFCAILPHMYGNPIGGFGEIVNLLHNSGCIVIEDCASSMGAQYESGGYTGHLGDFSIYSTGYSKTLDLGYGGIVASANYALEDLDFSMLDELPLYGGELERREQLFSRMYRCIRNERAVTEFESSIFMAFRDPLRNIFLCRIDDQKRDLIERHLEDLPDVVNARRRQYREYNEIIGELPKWAESYQMAEGAVPWRWCCFVEAGMRQRVIDECLKSNIPISDWYPPVSEYFCDTEMYQGARSMGSRILNLPIMLDDSRLREIAYGFKNMLEDCIV